MASKRARSGFEWPRVALTELEDASSGLKSARGASGNYRDPAQLKSSQLESAIYSFIHGLVLLYTTVWYGVVWCGMVKNYLMPLVHL